MSKTRGIGELDNFLYLQPLLEQLLATSQHTWSEKTLRHFPPIIREFLKVRVDKRGQVIQAWQQVFDKLFFILEYVPSALFGLHKESMLLIQIDFLTFIHEQNMVVFFL